MKFHMESPHMLSATKKSAATAAAMALRRSEIQSATATIADWAIPNIVYAASERPGISARR